MTCHLTYTGVYAGTYLCLRFGSKLGEGSWGERVPDDTAVHFAYASDAVIDDAETCNDCRHVARCGDESCRRREKPWADA